MVSGAAIDHSLSTLPLKGCLNGLHLPTKLIKQKMVVLGVSLVSAWPISEPRLAEGRHPMCHLASHQMHFALKAVLSFLRILGLGIQSYLLRRYAGPFWHLHNSVEHITCWEGTWISIASGQRPHLTGVGHAETLLKERFWRLTNGKPTKLCAVPLKHLHPCLDLVDCGYDVQVATPFNLYNLQLSGSDFAP